jgi:hypothetical protein
MVGLELHFLPSMGQVKPCPYRMPFLGEILAGQARPKHDRGIFTGMEIWNHNVVFK